MCTSACERGGAWSKRWSGAQFKLYSTERFSIQTKRGFPSSPVSSDALTKSIKNLGLSATDPALTLFESRLPARVGLKMEFLKYFECEKQGDRSYKCKIQVKTLEEEVEHEEECGDIVVVSKDSYYNLRRHVMRKHDEVVRKHQEDARKCE